MPETPVMNEDDREKGARNAREENCEAIDMPAMIVPPLSPLELRCLGLAAYGRTIDDIILETDLPCQRVRDAFAGAMRKLQAANLAEAIFRAARMRLI
ncbi:hypothetical protein [Ensifer soli]|uniref:hypothetical protein n=1 Tax=Ciceribacter sp. sgz301302 TaxID=3342379 RepID=UPI0035B9B1BD